MQPIFWLSRDGDLDIKAEIISEYHDRTHDELVVLIQEKLPVALGDKRVVKTSNEKLIFMIRELVQKLQKSEAVLTEAHKKELAELSEMTLLLSNMSNEQCVSNV